MSLYPETMFNVGPRPVWYGLGTAVKEAPNSAEAMKLAGLDWNVISEPIYDERGNSIPGYKLNVRDKDNAALGIVSDKYKPVQNVEAFSFTDSLLGEGCTYETAGSIANGKRVWLLARLEGTTLAEEYIMPYLLFSNHHNGRGAIRVAIVPVRVLCENMLNLAFKQAARQWAAIHRGSIAAKLDEAKFTLLSAQKYLTILGEEIGDLKLKKVTDSQVEAMTEMLMKIEFENLYKKALKNNKVTDIKEHLRQQKFEQKLKQKKSEILTIYHDKPDLVDTEKSAFRFVNAVSDYVIHTTNHRKTKDYQSNLFMRVVDGHSVIDTAHKIARAV